MNIFEITDGLGNTVEWVKIDKGNGEATWLTKDAFDEIEAAKENGTIS
jgi:hypothetical protein